MSRSDIYVRVGAALAALAIAASVVWAYGMTATIIGVFLATPSQKTHKPAEKGVVDVMVLPAPGTKPAAQPPAKPQDKPQSEPQNKPE